MHAVVYPPTNPDFAAPAGELPPYVVFVHGGPTSQAMAAIDIEKAFFTSRGLGVIDVNYGGSTGYGRAYRELLREQWGVVDVEDSIAAVQALAEAGRADAKRLVIRGGSAGGWTVLAALTRTDAFAAGASYYGVAELIEFADDDTRLRVALPRRADRAAARDARPLRRAGAAHPCGRAVVPGPAAAGR